MDTNLEHGNANSARLVSAAKGIQLSSQEFSAGQGLNDDVHTGQDGVGLGQEVTVAHKLGLGNISELAELLLVFGMGLDEATYIMQKIVKLM